MKIKGCGKVIYVKENKSNHRSFCGCNYKGLHLCEECKTSENAPKEKLK